MAIKNAQDPQCWKWWSFDHQEYWTVDTTDVIPILVKLRPTREDESDRDGGWETSGRWTTEAVADTENPDRIDEYPIDLILRIDKLFGSSFAKFHKDHYDNNKQKRDSKMNMKREHMESGAVGLVNCITEALEDRDGGVFENLTEEEKNLVENVVNDCFSFYVDNRLDDESKGDEKVLSFLEEFDSKQEIKDYIVEEEDKLKKLEQMLQQIEGLDSSGFGVEGNFSGTVRSLQNDLTRGRQWIADIKRLSV